MYGKIMVASDGSSLSMKAAQIGAAIAKAFSAKLVVATVAYFPKFYEGDVGAEMKEGYMEEWGRVLKETLEEVRRRDIEPEGKMIEGKPAEALLAEVERGKYDLLIVGRTGAGSLGSRMMGSVSMKLAANAACAVLVVR
jgi:nucleotide-binding universal stress UspA family protein